MNRRQSMSNGQQVPPGMKLVPASYQQEPIPMHTGPVQPFQPIPMLSQYQTSSTAYNNSLRNNRVAPPPPPDYTPYTQPNNSYRAMSSMNSTRPLAQTSQIPKNRQNRPSIGTIYDNNPNRPYGDYNQQNYQHENILPDDDLEPKYASKSWLSQPLCLGLTYLSGGILFGTMILLGVASIGGLIAAVILYIQDSGTDGQWKILGMVVSGIMLLTILVTLCIFIYCYKQGRIIGGGGNNNSLRSQPNEGNNYQNSNQRKPYGYNQSDNSSPIPYGMMQNLTPSSTNEDIIQVTDKQTNTETTVAPLRPRDFQRGVWSVGNLYGGISYRPLVQPKMVSRFIQVVPSEVDQSIQQRKNQAPSIMPRTMIRQPPTRIEYTDEQRPRHFIDQPPYEIVEEIIERPRRQQSEEYVEIIDLPQNGREQMRKIPGRQRYNKVTVKHIKPNEEQNIVVDDYNNDHFYQ